MDNLFLLIPLLACQVAMGVCMWMMVRGMRGGQGNEDPGTSLNELRAEQERIAARIGELEDGEAERQDTRAPAPVRRG